MCRDRFKLISYTTIWISLFGIVTAPQPGTFFWKPRLGIDLAIPTTESGLLVQKPNRDNIAKGVVVLLDGYQAGATVISLAAAIPGGQTYPHIDPLSAYFYTNVYRWGLRHFSLLPYWMSGSGGHYCQTHKVWRRRFYYMDEFLPKWVRKALPWVKKETWDKEEAEFKKFKKVAEPAFGKHFRYPSKKFRDYQSEETVETAEGDAMSSISSTSDELT